MAPRKKTPSLPPPTFDPRPSMKFGGNLLRELGVEHALIGKIAMWYWLENEADHEYTKDVDFAVPRTAVPLLLERLRAVSAEVKLLPIGGLNASIAARKVKTDFIDRSSDEWGDLQPLYLDAIRCANLAEDRSGGIPVASPEHLVMMKIGAGTDKDERDAVRLLAKVDDLDVDKARDIARRFLGSIGIGRLEECLRRAGHPKARRAYSVSS